MTSASDQRPIELSAGEIASLIALELKTYTSTNAKNFVVRAPQAMSAYLLGLVLKGSGMSKVRMEVFLAEHGFSDSEGRVLRRYSSGKTRMSWQSFHSLALLGAANGWIEMWICRGLIDAAFQREAAQLAARLLVNDVKRKGIYSDVPSEHLVEIFCRFYMQLEQESEISLRSHARTNEDVRELIRVCGLEIDR